MLDAAQWLIVVVGGFCALATFILLRYPASRRPQFRAAQGFSLPVSLLGAGSVMLLCLLMVWYQGQV